MHRKVEGAGAPTGQGWQTYDYVSPGLEVVRPDAAFPRMVPGDHLHHPWKHLRRDVPHTWYVDDRFPLMGFLNRDEAVLLHNIARQFAGRHALEIGSWLGWSTCHLALAGALVDVIDPAHDDPEFRAMVEESLSAAGVARGVRLAGGSSPEAVATLAGELGRGWSLFFVDGDHERPSPVRDALACLPHAEEDCAFVFHDLASPAIADGLRTLLEEGFQVLVYQTAQVMAMAWRGDVSPVVHTPDPDVAWQIPAHLLDLPICGVQGIKPRPVPRDRPAPSPSRDLRDLVDGLPSPGARPSVCVVTNELVGLHKNGGIGTSMTGLAETLAAAGMRVTVLYTRAIWEPELTIEPWRARYAELGIHLVTLPLEALASVKGPLREHGFAVPFTVYRYLMSNDFDVVHFNDCCGDGCLALAAKRLGLALNGSLLVTALHSPSQWVLEHNRTAPTSLVLAAFNYAERLSIRCTDVLWSPSRYLLDWARANGFALPEHTFVQQYAIPSLGLGGAPGRALPAGRSAPPREVVFFARLEERKGLALFCDAVDLLAEELAARDVTVTFLGTPQTCRGMPALDYIARRSASWPVRIRTLTDLGQPEALGYLLDGGRLAVMPSPVDNSPCTVYEALRWGVPFLAARTGGISELVHPDDQHDVLFDYSPAALRDALFAAVKDGGLAARPSVTQEESRRVFVGLHERWESVRGPVPEPRPPSAWAAAIVDHPPGANLDATLESLAASSWVRRVIVLDRAGGGARAGVTVLDALGEDHQAVRRELAMLAEDSVLLLHSGVSVLPESLARMLGALDTPSIDGLLPAAQEIGPDAKVTFVPPLGGSATFGLYEGVTFTGAMLIRRRALMEAVDAHGLNPEGPFLGLADACVAGGREIWPYAEVVLERPAGTEFDVGTSARARVGAYGHAPDLERYYMLAAGYGAAHGARSVSGRRERALALVELGLGSVVRGASVARRSARTVRARVGATPAGARLRRLRQR